MQRPIAPAADETLAPERLFAALQGARGVVAAVSGGTDSTALMVLLARWSVRPPVLVVCVDHGLRPESAGEARLATENGARLGLTARVMQAPPRPPGGNLQDWARRARYALLADAAHTAGYDVIVTAHHQEDQAETFLLRLARGSGVHGLAAMARETSISGIRLARPLLDVPREALAAVVAGSGLAASSDPSNEDLRFDRIRMRRLLPVLAEHRLTASRLSRTAGQLRRAAAALDHYAQACIAERFNPDDLGRVSGPVEALTGVPEETALRVLALLCRAAGGADYTPRLDRLESLYAALGTSRFRRTLHGATFELDRGVLRVGREWGRRGIPAVTAAAGSTILWDRRFRVHIAADASATEVGPLGVSGRRLRVHGRAEPILRTLPGLYGTSPNGERVLLAAPTGVDVADDGPKLGRLGAECLVAARLGLAVQPVQSP